MRDGEYLTMAYFKLDKMFCFRYRCVVSCMISAGRVCPPVDNLAAVSQETTAAQAHRGTELRDAAAAVGWELGGMLNPIPRGA